MLVGKFRYPTIWLILIAYVLCAFVYVQATPPFEASDELPHYEMVRVIRDEHRLPIQNPENPHTPWEQEASQPPLYYVLVAAVTSPFVSTEGVEIVRNPHAKLGLPGFTDNRNRVIHEDYPALEFSQFPDVYIGRIVSILLGAVTVGMVYAIGRLLFVSGTVPVLAAGLTAFNPMFLFISASINNDNLVIALNTITLYLTIQMIFDGFDLKRSVILAFVVAFATLSKLSGLVMVPIVVLAAFATAYWHRDWKGLALLGALMLGVWLAIAGWWYARNIQLYDELFGTHMMVKIAGARPESFTLRTLLDEFEGFRISYWGLFGMVNILVYPFFYELMDALVILAVAGFALFAYRTWRGDVQWQASDYYKYLCISLLVIALITGSISLINWTAQTYASQGRLLFPFVGATSILLSIGLVELLQRFKSHHYSLSLIVRVAVVMFALFALTIPIKWIMPVYSHASTVVQPNILPTDATPIYAQFDAIELIGYSSPSERFGPGEQVPITLYWHPLARSDRDLSLFVHVLNDAGDVIGKVDSYPGGGRLRTSTWKPDQIYVDHFGIAIGDDVQGQSRIRFKIGWWYAPDNVYLSAVDKNAQQIEHVILDGSVFVGESMIDTGQFSAIEGVRFGDAIELKGYHLEDQRLSLLWESVGRIPEDYVVFVHGVDVTDDMIVQGDAPPTVPTSYWLPGEQFVTVHELIAQDDAETNVTRLLIGWYHPDDFQRLPTDYPDAIYPLEIDLE